MNLIIAFKISAIGVLPILLVIVSAIFLWAIVVYNSLKSRKSNTEVYLQNVGRIAFQRVQLLGQLGHVLQTDLITDAEGYNEARLQAESNQINAAIESLGFADNADVRQLEQELTTNAALLIRTQRKFRSARVNYNELCQHMPYRIIASVFGFRPLATT